MDKDYDRQALDIAEFESFTKELYSWRSQISKDTQNVVIDAHDKIKWENSTILTVQEDPEGGRPFLNALIGFRVYREGGKK